MGYQMEPPKTLTGPPQNRVLFFGSVVVLDMDALLASLVCRSHAWVSRPEGCFLKAPLAILLLLLAFASSAPAQVFVTDGDTIEVDGTTYRLNGIDAPEFGQDCNGPTGTWKCGKAALSALVKLVEGRSVPGNQQ